MLFEFLRLLPPDIARYLPRFLQKDASFKSITDTITWEHERERQIAIDIYKQFFVSTATWGIADWERVVEVKPNIGDNLTQRQNRVLLKLNGAETATHDFMVDLVKRYTSEDSEVEIVTDNPHFLLSVVCKNGRILYPEDMLQAVDLYKQAHLGLVLNIVREYKMTDKDAIRAAILNNIAGQADIKTAMPAAGHTDIKAALAHMITGTRRLPFAVVDNAANNIAAFTAIFPDGRKDIAADKNDIERALWSILEPSRMTAKFGNGILQEGAKNIYAATPESGNISLRASVFADKNGLKNIRPAPPTTGKQNIFTALLNILDGRKDIAADREEYAASILDDSTVAPRLANVLQRGGIGNIKAAKPADIGMAAKMHFAAQIVPDGRKDIAANIEDLPDGGNIQSSRITPNFASVFQTEGQRQIYAANPGDGDAYLQGATLTSKSGGKHIFATKPIPGKIKQYSASVVLRGGTYFIGANGEMPIVKRKRRPHVGIMHVGRAL